MLTATVSLWTEQTLVLLQQRQAQSCRFPPALLCLRLFHGGVMLHLDTYHQLHEHTEEIHRDFWDSGWLSWVTGPARWLCPTTLFMWLPRNTLKRLHCTHGQAVVTGATLCIQTLDIRGATINRLNWLIDLNSCDPTRLIYLRQGVNQIPL